VLLSELSSAVGQQQGSVCPDELKLYECADITQLVRLQTSAEWAVVLFAPLSC
jgi:hypothetical protein